MANQSQDRRKGQRVDARLRLSVNVPLPDGREVSATVETLNISTSGIYFKSDHYIEPMTKLNMDLELPVDVQEGELSMATASCEGIVVRVLPERENESSAHYEIAVFFTSIDPEGLQHLQHHIAMLLTTAT